MVTLTDPREFSPSKVSRYTVILPSLMIFGAMPCHASLSFPFSGAHFHRENLVDMKAMNVITQTASELARRDVEQNMDSNIAVRAQVLYIPYYMVI